MDIIWEIIKGILMGIGLSTIIFFLAIIGYWIYQVGEAIKEQKGEEKNG